MTKEEEKQLLLKDLCGRLPYGVKILDIPANTIGTLYLISTTDTVEYEPAEETNDDNWTQTLYNIKPYLRSLSSMTDEEFKEYSKYAHFGNILIDWAKSIDYLNSHHFDYRGLIHMGLALEAKEGIYKTQ